jgi:type IV pilus assembly protein PilC
MKDFRVTGKKPDGTPIQVVLTAKDKKEAAVLLERKGIIINKLEPRREFMYTVTTPNGKKIKGKKNAFTAQELRDAFEKYGYKRIKVDPVLFKFNFKPPFDTILQFINLSAFMLEEEMTYDKILEILSEEEQHETFRSTLKTIQMELKKGREGEEVFKEHEDVFGRFPAYMLGLATKSGNMVEVYRATAKFMDRDREHRKTLRTALMEPMLTLVLTLVAIFYYVIAIFPATATLFERFNLPVPPMTKATIAFSNYLMDNWWWIALIIFTPCFIAWLWFKTKKGAYFRDKYIVRLPMIGHLLHKQSIEIFFRVFAAIYAGADNNIDTLRHASEACRNKWMEAGVNEVSIPLMLRDGASLVPALNAAKVFNKQTLNRLRMGAETGNVLASSEQIARYYELETTYKMRGVILSIQNFVMIFIGVVITAITIVSSEIAMVTPSTPGVSGM